MSKRSTITTIAPVPPSLTRIPLLSFLHDLPTIVRLNPLVISATPIPPPPHCAPSEVSATWFQLQDKLTYLPTGKHISGILYTAALTPTPTGLTSHIYAPMGVDIRSTWILAGRVAGEEPASGWLDGQDKTVPGLYLREDVEFRCNLALVPIVKKTLLKSHEAMTAKLEALARRPRAHTGPELSLREYQRVQDEYNERKYQQTSARSSRPISHTPGMPVLNGNYKFEEYRAPVMAFEKQQQQQAPKRPKREATKRYPTAAAAAAMRQVPGYSHGYSQSDAFGPGISATTIITTNINSPPLLQSRPINSLGPSSVFTFTPRPTKSPSPSTPYTYFRAPVRTLTAQTTDSYTSAVASPTTSNNEILISALSPPHSGDQPVFNLHEPTPITPVGQEGLSPRAGANAGHIRSHSAPSPVEPRRPAALNLVPGDVEPEQQQTPLLHNNLYLPPPPPRNRVRSNSAGRPGTLQPMGMVKRPLRPMSTPFMAPNEPWVSNADFYYEEFDEEEDRNKASTTPSVDASRSPKPRLSPLIIPNNVGGTPTLVKDGIPEPYFLAGLRLQQQFAEKKPTPNVPVMQTAPKGHQNQHKRIPSGNVFENATMVLPPSVAIEERTPRAVSGGPTRTFSFAETPTDLVAKPVQYKFHESPVASKPPTLRDSVSTVSGQEELEIRKQLESMSLNASSNASAPSAAPVTAVAPPPLRYPIEFRQQYASPEKSVGFFPLAHTLSNYAREKKLPFHSSSPTTSATPDETTTAPSDPLSFSPDASPYPQPLRIEKWMASVRPASIAMAPPLPDDIPTPLLPSVSSELIPAVKNSAQRQSLLKPSVSVVSKYPHAKEQDYTDIAGVNPFDGAEEETMLDSEIERRRSVLQSLGGGERGSWVGPELFGPVR